MAKKVKLDFTGVESYERASEGKHKVKIVSVEETSSQGGNDCLKVCFEVVSGAEKGARVYETYPLVETALWKLQALLKAIGMRADGKIMLDLDKMVGKVLFIEVKHEEYQGVTRARVAECKKFVADDEEDDDEDSDDSDDDDEEDDDEEEEEKPKKTSKKKADKKPSKKKKKPEPEEEEEDDEEDEEEEEKPKKAAKKKKADKKPAKSSKKKKPEPEDGDEEDWDDDDEEDWDEE